MTKYRLKDRELQKKLDDITAGGFSKVLEKKIDVTFFYEEFLFLGASSIQVRLFESAFEEVPEPKGVKGWSKWPDVKPVEGVVMRTQFKFIEQEYRLAGFYRERYNQWEFHGFGRCDALGLREIENGSLKDFYFRPWDEENE